MARQAQEQPLVSVVIVNWNGWDDTKLCLDHSRKQTYKNFEVVIVDNGSTDGSVEHLRQLKDIVLVENPKNLGFTGGHIAGYKAARGDFILLLNNDAIMDKDYIANAVQTMQSDETIGAAGGRAYLWDEDNPLMDRANRFYAYQNINLTNAEGIFTQTDFGVPQEVNVVSGSCVLVRRSVIEKVGYLHDPFFAYFEEVDLFARMKRAGYKVIYNPKLAIWHANSKTSNRKAPTFAYYMMMRNRFRFAVRNFDAWSLRRFLKFYFRLGLVCIVKLPLTGEMRPIRKAYAKAFLYNLVCGWLPFIERRQLRRQLGPTNYNQLIFNEQTPYSIVSAADSKSALADARRLSETLRPGSEVIAVTSKLQLFSEAESVIPEYETFRLCRDKGFFKTHRENLGAVAAKNEYIIITQPSNLKDSELFKLVPRVLYDLYKTGKRAAAFGQTAIAKMDRDSLLSAPVGQTIILRKSLYLEAGGLASQLSLDDALRAILVYAFLGKSLGISVITKVKYKLPAYSGKGMSSSVLFGFLHARHQEILIDRDRPDVFNNKSGIMVFVYFRLSQLRYLLQWLFSRRIGFYLKLARIKNLVLAVLFLNRRRFSLEMAHIRNELIGSEYRVDLAAMKEKENERLKYLRNHPEETILFIITLNRYEMLVDMLDWLKKGGMKRVVLVDNGSSLPALVEYLNSTDYQVLEMGYNSGNRVLWNNGIIRILNPDDFYILNDPDIIPELSARQAIPHLYDVLEKYPNHLKVGLGLKIDDLPDHYALKAEVIKWESQFWHTQLEEGVYEAGVDTTFALYRPHTYLYFIHPSLRTAEPYMARHLPWYLDSSKLSREELFYRMHQDNSITSWNYEELPERYKNELTRNGL